MTKPGIKITSYTKPVPVAGAKNTAISIAFDEAKKELCMRMVVDLTKDLGTHPSGKSISMASCQGGLASTQAKMNINMFRTAEMTGEEVLQLAALPQYEIPTCPQDKDQGFYVSVGRAWGSSDNDDDAAKSMKNTHLFLDFPLTAPLFNNKATPMSKLYHASSSGKTYLLASSSGFSTLLAHPSAKGSGRINRHNVAMSLNFFIPMTTSFSMIGLADLVDLQDTANNAAAAAFVAKTGVPTAPSDVNGLSVDHKAKLDGVAKKDVTAAVATVINRHLLAMLSGVEMKSVLMEAVGDILGVTDDSLPNKDDIPSSVSKMVEVAMTEYMDKRGKDFGEREPVTKKARIE